MDSTAKQTLFDNFDSVSYMRVKADINDDFIQKSKRFSSDWMYSVFSTGTIRGDILLDIGTGPNVHSVLYAAPYFNKIYMSDFSKSNREFLEQWRSGEHSELLRHLFERAVNLEGNVQTPEEKEELLKSKIKGVLKCDIMQANPLVGNQNTCFGQFDAITTSLCVNSAVENYEEWSSAVKNITSLIKPGGYLIMMDLTSGKQYYLVNQVEYPEAALNVAKIKTMAQEMFPEVFSWAEEYIEEKPNDRINHMYNFVAKI